MGLETYLAQIAPRSIDEAASPVELVGLVGRGWRGVLKPCVFSKSIKIGIPAEDLRSLVESWPGKETVGRSHQVHSLDVSAGPFWRSGFSTSMAWANVDFDAPCRDCAAQHIASTCSHKDPLEAAVELAYADAFAFHELLEKSGLQASGFVDGRFVVGDYTLVLSGRRGVGVLFSRLLPPYAYAGLRQRIDELDADFPTLDKGALRTKPGPVRLPLSQHPGEPDGPNAGLRLPLDPALIGPTLTADEARLLQKCSLVWGRAAREGDVERVGHLGDIFAGVMLPRADRSEPWKALVGRLDGRAPDPSTTSSRSDGVPDGLEQACRDLGLFRGSGSRSVWVWCPLCGERTAWMTPDRVLRCFRQKCPANKTDGGLPFEAWHRQSNLPPERILRVFRQAADYAEGPEHTVVALRGLLGRDLPFRAEHVRPRHRAGRSAGQGAADVAFFDPWLAAYYGEYLSETLADLELRADAEGILNTIGSGHVPLDEFPTGAHEGDADVSVPAFDYWPHTRSSDLAEELAHHDTLHLEFDANPEFVWLSFPDGARLIIESKVLGEAPVRKTLGALDTLVVSTTDDLRHLLDRVPYAQLRRLPIRTLELAVRLLNNRRQSLPVPFSRWRLARKLSPEPLTPLGLADLLYEAVDDHDLTETCRLENAIAVDVAAMERAAPCIDKDAVDLRREQLEANCTRVEQALQQFVGPCANLHRAGEIRARFAEEGVLLDNVQDTTLARAADAADGPAARWLTAYRRWRQMVTRANELRLLDVPLSDEGRAHPTVDQLGTSTARFSWSKPPLGSISKDARKYLHAAHHRVLVSVDISQAQLRIAADLSGDPGLLAVFESRQDVHRAIATQLFGEPPDDHQRSQAKAVSFGVLLGMGARKLVDYAADFGAKVTADEAAALIERFFAQFPKVRRYRQDLFHAMQKRGSVVTPSGRRCQFDPHSDDLHPGTTLAYVLQMTEADIIKAALLQACNALDLDRARPSIVLHDELIVEADESYADEAGAVLERALADSLNAHLKRCAPGPLEAEVAKRWAEG
jgi:hypothetical protein